MQAKRARLYFGILWVYVLVEPTRNHEVALDNDRGPWQNRIAKQHVDLSSQSQHNVSWWPTLFPSSSNLQQAAVRKFSEFLHVILPQPVYPENYGNDSLEAEKKSVDGLYVPDALPQNSRKKLDETPSSSSMLRGTKETRTTKHPDDSSQPRPGQRNTKLVDSTATDQYLPIDSRAVLTLNKVSASPPAFSTKNVVQTVPSISTVQPTDPKIAPMDSPKNVILGPPFRNFVNAPAIDGVSESSSESEIFQGVPGASAELPAFLISRKTYNTSAVSSVDSENSALPVLFRPDTESLSDLEHRDVFVNSVGLKRVSTDVAESPVVPDHSEDAAEKPILQLASQNVFLSSVLFPVSEKSPDSQVFEDVSSNIVGSSATRGVSQNRGGVPIFQLENPAAMSFVVRNSSKDFAGSLSSF